MNHNFFFFFYLSHIVTLVILWEMRLYWNSVVIYCWRQYIWYFQFILLWVNCICILLKCHFPIQNCAKIYRFLTINMQLDYLTVYPFFFSTETMLTLDKNLKKYYVQITCNLISVMIHLKKKKLFRHLMCDCFVFF